MSGSAPPVLAPIVAALPASTPFVPPEAIERQSGHRFRLRLGANESLFGPAASVLAAMAEAAREIQLYGDPECWELRQAIARHHGLGPEHVVVASGADELLGLFVRAYLAPGELAVMSLGGYPTMAYQLDGHGARIERVPYASFRNDGAALAETATRTRARLIYLANPDNPTGSWLDAEEQRRLMRHLPPRCLLLIDEAYADLAPPEALPPVDGEDRRIVRIRTFSKAHGLAGMRVGYAFGAPETIRPIDRIRNQFGVGRLAQAAALAAIRDRTHVAAVRGLVEEGKRDHAAMAEKLGIVALPSATNFTAFDLGSGERARAVLTRLRDRHGVFVRTGTGPLDRLLRITIGPEADRAVLAEALAEAVEAR